MLDTGSDRDVISEDIIRRLDMATTTKLMTVKTVSGADTQDRKLANFTLRSLTGSYNADVEEALVGKLLTSSSDCPPCRRDVSEFSHLSDITFDDINNGDKIEFIIGVGHCATWFGVEC